MIDTIVVGAGIAGITTARLLQHAGRRVVVLEARDRIGGRILTDRTAGFCVDRGASWIHGLTGNPLTDIVAGLGIDTLEFTVGSFQPGGRPIANYDEEAHVLSPEATRAWTAEVAEADARVVSTVTAAGPQETYEQVTARAVADLGWDGARASRVGAFYRHRTEEQCGAHITEVAASGLDEDAIDGDEVIFPGGYDELPRILAEGLDIRLGTPVTSIEWSADGVRVGTAEGSFRAAHAVVTVSLGVLKAGAIDIRPPLPDPVAGAIDRLGMGVFNKVFLEFPHRFWPDDVYAVRQLGAPSFPWHTWYDISAISGRPMLLTFAGGRWGREIETMSDSAVTESAVAPLRRLYPDSVPDPVNSWVTRWGSDQYARGSYSYVATGSTYADHDVIATPIGGGALHLAGEATWGAEPATVHSALLSGHRAAERILDAPVALSALIAGARGSGRVTA
ncbi:flavin monoamine oxidase family protein [Tsukamurella spumae]|uniref:FAD-dependent oxidoreductase n=1 Tax=Tsukamurella spumae TaxID=44753 RepID=A0A846WZX8_9ACTN|nr:NAD(P)/FAD-dependent oxidoreductase [Tsukamurella spumae]NKY17906.1 FAD-dependent oxidoreductase [Tsukamurella spumae]